MGMSRPSAALSPGWRPTSRRIRSGSVLSSSWYRGSISSEIHFQRESKVAMLPVAMGARNVMSSTGIDWQGPHGVRHI